MSKGAQRSAHGLINEYCFILRSPAISTFSRGNQTLKYDCSLVTGFNLQIQQRPICNWVRLDSQGL